MMQKFTVKKRLNVEPGRVIGLEDNEIIKALLKAGAIEPVKIARKKKTDEVK